MREDKGQGIGSTRDYRNCRWNKHRVSYWKEVFEYDLKEEGEKIGIYLKEKSIESHIYSM
jgi:hypothetical protein